MFKWYNSVSVKLKPFGELSEASFLLIHLTRTGTLRQKWPYLPQLIFIFIVLAPVTYWSPRSFKITAGGRKWSSFVLTWPRQKSKTERERKQSFILQHLVQSAPRGWTPTGGSTPVVKESGGWKLTLFFYSIKNACGWSAWITCRATSKNPYSI